MDLQPDQTPALWDNHVSVYERVFEPFSLGFARAAIDRLDLAPASNVLDVGCGAGGAALQLATQSHRVTAIDASPCMIARTRERSSLAGAAIDAAVMDGMALDLPDDSFDAALSVFGVILFPDAVRGMSELRRVVRPVGRVAVVTWTEPQNYELAAEFRAATLTVDPDRPPAPLPAQLRYREASDFTTLFEMAGLKGPRIETVTSRLDVPSARWVAENIAFAPGMAAMVEGLGVKAPKVLDAFIDRLELRYGPGPIKLAGVALIGVADVL